MISRPYNKTTDGHISLAEPYPHDDGNITLQLQYAEPSESEKPEYKFRRFFTDKVTAHILAKGLSEILATPDADAAWRHIAERAAGPGCGEEFDNLTEIEKSALAIMNPPQKEIEAGEKAAQLLVEHMQRMKAAATEFHIHDGNGVWNISIDFQSKSSQPN